LFFFIDCLGLTQLEKLVGAFLPMIIERKEKQRA